jgi:hypothetical protein
MNMKAWLCAIWVGLATLRVLAGSFQEDFSSAPSLQGWRIAGDADLFYWDAVEQVLDVTWDSSKPNSYFYRSLRTILAKTDDFQLSFDLTLRDIAVGVNPARPFTFEVAVGLLNFSAGTNASFLRGTGAQSPDLAEFDYFPDSGFGATISTVIASSNSQLVPSFTFPLELTTGDLFHIQLSYTASNQTLATLMQRNGQPFGPIKEVQLSAAFADYRLDTVSVSSYSDAGADGSLLAHGLIDNVAVSVPDPPLSRIQGTVAGNLWEVQFTGATNWIYSLERTADFISWRPVSAGVPGTGSLQTLWEDIQAPLGAAAFYRIHSERP